MKTPFYDDGLTLMVFGAERKIAPEGAISDI
jgi:hypothetical protein